MEALPFLKPFYYFVDFRERVFLLYLASSFLIALFIHLYDRRARLNWTFGSGSSTPHVPNPSPVREIFPKEVYSHPSAKTDYIYFICNVILYGFILLPFQLYGAFFSGEVYNLFSLFLTPAVARDSSAMWLYAIVGAVLILVSDFGTFLAHYLAHKVRFLWEFHKVHHSAAVMTPITVYRMHPVDDVFTMILAGTLTGAADAVIRFFLIPDISPFLLLVLNITAYVFYLTGYHLRHSHVWLSYGPVVSRFLISPAQHQVHHSVSKPHWDKNFGFIFAIWDWLFGTLYVPKEREHLTFGIGRKEEEEYSSVLRLYFLPFKKAWKVLRR
jgi:sterol desaturase/sphingolipid hydroxylase (fatty acid hydroxylase superfamily)